MNVDNVRNSARIATSTAGTKSNRQPLDQIINQLAKKKFEIIAGLFLLSTLSLFVVSAATSFILWGGTAAFAILMFQAGKNATPANNTELKKSVPDTGGQTVEPVAESKDNIDELTALERDFPQLCQTPSVFTTRDECLQYFLFIETLAELLNGLNLTEEKKFNFELLKDALVFLNNGLKALKKHPEDRLEKAMPHYLKTTADRLAWLKSQFNLFKKSINEIKGF